MKRREDLLKLLSEPVLKAVLSGALSIDWNPDTKSKETWTEYGAPHKIFVAQCIPDELLECEVRHQIRHIIFRHNDLQCKLGGDDAKCREIASEIEATKFVSLKQEEVYRKAGIKLVSPREPAVRKLFEDTYVQPVHISDFPAEELHAVLCKKLHSKQDGEGEGSGKGKGEGRGEGKGGKRGNASGAGNLSQHCSTLRRSGQKKQKGSGKSDKKAQAATLALASTLAKQGYKDKEVLKEAAGLLGGRGSGNGLWEEFVEVRPAWVEKVLEVLSPELCFERRRYIPKPLWSPLLLSERWIPSIRSRYAYRKKRAVLLVDTSGSMFCVETLNTIKPGIIAILKRGLKVRLICGDDGVTLDTEIENLTEENIEKIKLPGSGGTVYDPLLECAMKYKPETIVFITDLEPNYWPQNKPSVPVYFVIPKGKACRIPWGKILCEVDGEEIQEPDS